ncbi:hypothetical protein, partial [Niastella vici]|uniref:hypothetical protein n=1 Tax=Niastella vici TaxID=1703345 RepID=UPI00130206D9
LVPFSNVKYISEQSDDCKKRLCDLLEAIFSPNLVQQAENFQTRFLQIDLFIQLLREETIRLEALSKGDIKETHLLKILQPFLLKVEDVEQSFNKLKEEFFSYLIEIA